MIIGVHGPKTTTFPDVVAGLRQALPHASGWFDGELTVLAADGRPDFYRVIRRHGLTDPRKIEQGIQNDPASLMLFDVIERSGQRLTSWTLRDRRLALSDILHPADAIHQVESWPGESGTTLLSAVAARDLEGVVGKRLDSRYHLDTRSRDWVKVKCWKEREVTLLGLRQEPFGVLVGDHPGTVLCVIELGWGPTERSALRRLLPELQVRMEKGVSWLRPYLTCRMRYRLTPSGVIREPVFAGFVQAVARAV